MKLFGLLAMVLLVGCGNCGANNVSAAASGQLLVSPDPVGFAQVPIGQSEATTVTLLNVDLSPLTIYDIQLEARGDGGSVEGIALEELPDFPLEIPAEGQVQLVVRYTPEVGQRTPRAQLVIPSSDARYTADEPKTVAIDALGNEPRLEAVPAAVRFVRLTPGNRDTQAFTLRNVGSAPLKIWETPTYGGGADFRLIAPPTTFPLELEVWDADAAADDPDTYEYAMTVEYAPVGDGGETGEIQVTTNDPFGQLLSDDGELRSLKVFPVDANADSPCILVDGVTRNFGQVPIGELANDVVSVSNCGSQPLIIRDILLSENSADNEFSIDLRSWDANDDGALDRNVTLQPAEDAQFFLRYTPVQVGSDTGTVKIFSNDPVQGELDLQLVGRGSEGICPVADAGAYVRGVSAIPRQSISAAPLQYVVLDGSASSDEDGRVVDYMWEVVAWPAGTTQPQLDCTDEDVACNDMSKRQFRLLTAGEYVVDLRVRDNEGFVNCGDPARVVIRSVPAEKILVELTWTNPEDPDETDDVGSDVDLHLVKMGPGAWFQTPYDVYFRNPNNGAGSEANGIWTPESPSLDIDDRDGAGPENIQMDDPANCEWYAIGVHYYRQLFGTAYATIRVYINQQLVYEAINKPMTRGGQFWDVARIHWDSGQVYGYDNMFDVAPNNSAPDVTPSMASSGLCTTQELYPIQ